MIVVQNAGNILKIFLFVFFYIFVKIIDMITSKELRQKYIEFFKSKGHTQIPSASLIPENDPSVLFTTAGMHPLVPFLSGEKHPGGKRLVNVQKCVRTGDIDGVGNQWHLSFFEMLGNWSLGDYGRREALKWSFEFLTAVQYLGIGREKIAVSVFAGDDDAPFDEESYNIWLELGMPEERIYRYSKKENWWGPAGETGPCGPDSEMFYITDKEPCGKNCQPRCDCGKYVEIWNDVFMEYNKVNDGEYEPLSQKNIDTGMGLERMIAVLNGFNDDYQELLKPVVAKIEELSRKKYGKNYEVTRSMRVIADHIRAATFIMGDDSGVAPSNVDQGYVVRKLMRRAIRHGRLIGINQRFASVVARVVIQTMENVYVELNRNGMKVLSLIDEEEEKFLRTLQQGLKIFRKQVKKIDNKKISGKLAFDLFQTYGFPFEVISELAGEQSFSVDEDEFQKEFEKHQKLSRSASVGKFKGGLGDHSSKTIEYHTATHLLHRALRDVLGEHVEQRGSNITRERLRFDFSHGAKLADDEIRKVEEIVNQKIKDRLDVKQKEMSVEEAEKQDAIGIFRDKYGKRVKIYSIGNYSKEICGGPHVNNTSELGYFKIIKEESCSAGVRRIKAVLQ